MSDEARGTFACPICRKETPHHHSDEEVFFHRYPTRPDWDNQWMPVWDKAGRQIGDTRTHDFFGATLPAKVDPIAQIEALEAALGAITQLQVIDMRMGIEAQLAHVIGVLEAAQQIASEALALSRTEVGK